MEAKPNELRADPECFLPYCVNAILKFSQYGMCCHLPALELQQQRHRYCQDPQYGMEKALTVLAHFRIRV